jgi:hypothetical protein
MFDTKVGILVLPAFRLAEAQRHGFPGDRITGWFPESLEPVRTARQAPARTARLARLRIVSRPMLDVSSFAWPRIGLEYAETRRNGAETHSKDRGEKSPN